ncbi:MAG: CDP-alcohol phosphatidyltransferase family protein [Flavobacteriales bacterium]|nr:CDP-alcohol phosphatidyltransferase family protein [Flavobacteriales bacterium]
MGSILLASQGQLTWACWLVFLGALFDVFDGLAARALGGGSPLGAQLDSLADMVTFGVAPGMIIWFVFKEGGPADLLWYRDEGGWSRWWSIPTAAMVVPIASAWRLAKFNVDIRQTTGFLGLATPANALFWASIPLILIGTVFPEEALWCSKIPGTGSLGHLILDAIYKASSIILWTSLLLAVLMLSEIPLPSLKFKHFKWTGNEVIYLLLVIGAVLVVLYGILAVPLILVLYLLSPLWGRLFPKAA